MRGHIAHGKNSKRASYRQRINWSLLCWGAEMKLCVNLWFHEFPLGAWFFWQPEQRYMVTPENSVKGPWVGNDRRHTSSKLVYVTHWKAVTSNLHVVLTSMSIWFSRLLFYFVLLSVFCVFCFCFGSYALFRKGQIYLRRAKPTVEHKGHRKMRRW